MSWYRLGMGLKEVLSRDSGAQTTKGCLAESLAIYRLRSAKVDVKEGLDNKELKRDCPLV
jgi:hypothetical protein